MLSVQPAKRPRDDSDWEDDRYFKRCKSWTTQQQQQQHEPSPPQILPLRPSSSHAFTSPQQEADFFTRAMTPVQSEQGSPPILHRDASLNSDPAMDVDMDDFDIVSSQPPDSPLAPFMRPAKLNAQLWQGQDVNNTGRMPTPIYGTFYPPKMAVGRSNSDLSAMVQETSTVRKQYQMPMDRDKRMPSPISEDELPDTPTAMTQTQLSRLSVTEGMDMDDVPQPLPSPQTARKGRARSGAFTEKRKFSMGYRDDCEKCRARIPGHYSHFLPA